MGVIIPQVLTEDKVSGAQIVDGSLKFDSGKSQYLNRTLTTVGNRRTWTASFWFKKGKQGNWGGFLHAGDTDSVPGDFIYQYSDNTWYIQGHNGSGDEAIYQTTQLIRDIGWYHGVFVVDTTQATESERQKLYINGQRVTNFASTNGYSQNYQTEINNTTYDHRIGRTFQLGSGTNAYIDGQFTQYYFIDGQALDPSYFGYTDPLTNTWRPKKFESQYTDAPNNINTTWSDSLSASVSFNSSYPAVNAFDGNLETFASGSGGSQYLELSSTFTNVTSLRIKCAHGITLEGETYTISGTGITTKVISSDSEATNLTSITLSNTTISNIRVTSSSGLQPRICAIEINGVILVNNAGWGKNGFYLPLDGNTPIGQDQSGRGNNWTPVNFGGSNTIEKATGALPILNTDGGGKVARVGVRTDAYASNLVVAMPLVGITTDVSNLVNSGTTAKTVTQTGSASDIAASSTQSNFYGRSAYFQGNVARLEISGGGGVDGDYDFGTGDFTMECWFYPTALVNTNNRIFCSRGDRNNYQLMVGSAGYLQFDISGTNYTSASSLIAANKQWYHLAVTRASGTLRLFINGVIVKEQASVTADLDETTGIDIGYETGFSSYINGYMQDARVYKGLAKYTQNFIPASTDPDILPDTPSGVAGSSKLASIPIADGGAVAFDGSGDFLKLSQSDDFDLSGNYTYEAFIYYTDTVNNPTIFDFSAAASNYEGRLQVQAGTLYIYDAGWQSRGAISANVWHHIAVTQSYVFVDGINVGASAGAISGANYKVVTIGARTNDGGSTHGDYFTGTISNVRIVNGTALYTSNFTPPSAPLTATETTKLLCCKSNSLAGAATSSPNISGINDGTVWSEQGSFVGIDHATYKEPGALFTSGTGTSVVERVLSSDTSGSYILYLPPYDISYSSSFSLYLRNGDTDNSTFSYSINGGANYINLTTSGAGSWVDISGSGTITSTNGIRVKHITTAGTNAVDWRGIKIDSVQLLDPVSPFGNSEATNFNPFTANINAVRGQESGYATLNPLFPNPNGGTYSNGNLRIATAAGNGHYRANIGMSTGKWYWETVPVSGATPGIHGIGNDSVLPSQNPGQSTGSFGYYSVTGYKQTSGTDAAYGSTYTYGDVIGCAYDASNGKIYWSKNGVWQGGSDPVAGTNAAFTSVTNTPYYPLFCAGSGTDTVTVDVNFGQKPFKFPPPAGFQPLALANTPRPTIVRPDQYVGISTWTGDDVNNRKITTNFKPDLFWAKSRSSTPYHTVNDSVRGVNAILQTNTTSPEQVNSNGYVTAFLSDGVTVTNGSDINSSSYGNYVGWAWKAGGSGGGLSFWKDDIGYSTASAAGLTAGTITPTAASINTKSGFSIITWNGSGASGTISHGLGNTPGLIFLKGISAGEDGQNWRTYHSVLGTSPSNTLFLNLTNASSSNTERISAVGTSTFTLSSGGTGVNASGQSYIAYLWAEIPGFSKFGSYIGNGITDGPMIVTGFRPRWILLRETGNADYWFIFDTERSKTNPTAHTLWADQAQVENWTSINPDTTYNNMDILSNGFKLRSSYSATNRSSGTYIFAAFAESPSFNLYGGQSNAR